MADIAKNLKLCYLANFSPKLITFFTFLAGLWFVFGHISVIAASITVSPPKFEISAEKGQVLQREITITNGDAADLTLNISAANFTARGESGEAAFTEGDGATSAFSLSSWLTLPNGHVTVPANNKLVVPFTMSIPLQAESGGHFGTIFFSPVAAGAGNIAVQQKVGVLLLVRVAGEVVEQGKLESFGAYGADLKADDIAKTGSQSIFEDFPLALGVRFTNTGNVHTKPIGKIIIKNTFGRVLTRVGEKTIITPTGAVSGSEVVDYIPVNDRAGNVLPNSSRVFLQPWKGYGSYTLDENGNRAITWRGLGVGRYTAELELSYGAAQLPKQIIHFWIIPWKILSIIIVILAALILGLRQWKKMSRAKLKEQLRQELEQEQDITNQTL